MPRSVWTAWSFDRRLFGRSIKSIGFARVVLFWLFDDARILRRRSDPGLTLFLTSPSEQCTPKQAADQGAAGS